MSSPDKLSLVVFSASFERVHYALCLAAAAAATNRPVTLFFTMGATQSLLPDGWRSLSSTEGLNDAALQSRNVVGFQDLLDSCLELGVAFMVCEMGLQALGLKMADLDPNIPITAGGIVTFLADASADGAMLFI